MPKKPNMHGRIIEYFSLGYANQLDNGALYPHRKGTKCAAAVCPFIILVTYDDDE